MESQERSIIMTDEQLEICNRRFNLTKEQWEKFFEWQESLPYKYYGASSNGITVYFPSCGLGTIVIAKRDEGEEIDLSDYENF